MITMIAIKMQVNKPQTVYFNPPLLYVKEIQLIEIWTSTNRYFIFCDAIDSSYSLISFEKSGILNPSKLIGMYPRAEPYISYPINKSELTNLTFEFKEPDFSTPVLFNAAILNLKIIHE